MALTAAERQKKRREKLKNEGKYEEYKEKNKAEAIKSRNKKQNDLAKLPKSVQNKVKREIRENVRKRVAKCRALKSKASSSNDITPFKNNNTLGKAVSRAKRSLPASPRKQKAVIKKLFESEIGQTDAPSSPCITHELKRMPIETVNLVTQFYLQDDISRQAPGRKDVTTIRNDDGSKEKIQTKHLQHSIKEVYALFAKQYPDIKIGKSKFAELRPKYIQLSNKLPHNVCLCKYHENFIMALDSLNKQIPHIPKYSEDFPSMLICNVDSENCWYNQCIECKEGKVFKDLCGQAQDFGERTVTWFVWKKCEDRLCKVIEEGVIEDLIDYICKLIPEFLDHCYVKRFQARVYKLQHALVTSKTYPSKMAVMQVDFAENYKCISQDEIQSAHWMQNQVSLFTAALYHSGKMHPYVIASDELSHSKETVIPLITRMLDEIPKETEVLHIWSDGPSSQFKNKYIAATIPMLQEKYKLLITWNFFATSHGKGPVDGIGGSVKRQVWEAVKKRKQFVYNAGDFVNAVTSDNVKISEMTPSDLQLRSKELDLDNLFYNAEAVEGIKSQHFLEVINGITKSCKLSKAKFREESTEHSSEKPDTELNVGNWVLVPFAGKRAIKHFAAQIISKEVSSIKVKFLKCKGNSFIWPVKEDSSDVEVDIADLRKLPEPNFDRRFNFTFPNFDFSKYTMG